MNKPNNNYEYNQNKFEKYLSMNPKTFDQSEDGRRGFSDGGKEFILSDFQNKTKFINLVELLKFYINNYKFDFTNLQHKKLYDLIKFHIGQIYAEIEDYQNALLYFEKLKGEGYEGVGIKYLDFTIAFLKGDNKTMDEIQLKMPQDEINFEVVQRMNKYRKFSYLEAYRGMNLQEMKGYIQLHNK